MVLAADRNSQVAPTSTAAFRGKGKGVVGAGGMGVKAPSPGPHRESSISVRRSGLPRGGHTPMPAEVFSDGDHSRSAQISRFPVMPYLGVKLHLADGEIPVSVDFQVSSMTALDAVRP